MRLMPSDPDIETIVGRIRKDLLDLQPDFQRGAVWSVAKQRLLIDSILRNWYVPPIHVVQTADGKKQEVLDGQQRLNAIWEFVAGEFTVDGDTEPFSPHIQSLGGLRYATLPDDSRNLFDRFSVRQFELVDYEPEEPFELFYRLNQPTTLTSAEKRNAFFGETRAQIRSLTESAEKAGMEPSRIGFSNARLAYEDVIARYVCSLEEGTLAAKVTAAKITARYRSPQPFPPAVVSRAELALEQLFDNPAFDDEQIRLNKATAHSWLLFLSRAIREGVDRGPFSAFFAEVERARTKMRAAPEVGDISESELFAKLIPVLNDRATSRVNDVSSVVLRDVILWVLFAGRARATGIAGLSDLATAAAEAEPRELERTLLRTVDAVNWESLG